VPSGAVDRNKIPVHTIKVQERVLLEFCSVLLSAVDAVNAQLLAPIVSPQEKLAAV